MKKTKRDIIVDSAGLIAVALCLVVMVACKSTSEHTSEPTTLATIEENTEYITEPTQIEITDPPGAEPFYTMQDIEYLAMAIYQVAGADYISDETRLMVGTVIMNRVADPRFPDTIYGVLTAKKDPFGKFHLTGMVWSERADTVEEWHAVDRAWDCAIQVLSGYRSFDASVVWLANFEQGSYVVAYQDGIYFCR